MNRLKLATATFVTANIGGAILVAEALARSSWG
jgi:hypothetical protein